MTTDSTPHDSPVKRAQTAFDHLIETLCAVNRHRFFDHCAGCEQCDALLIQYRDATAAYDTAIADFLRRQH